MLASLEMAFAMAVDVRVDVDVELAGNVAAGVTFWWGQ